MDNCLGQNEPSMKMLLEEYGIRMDKPGIYESAAIHLPFYAKEISFNIEIQIISGDADYNDTLYVLLVPDVDGIVERLILLACTFYKNDSLEDMLVADMVKENLISDTKALNFSAKHNAYFVEDPKVFVSALRKLLCNLPDKTFTFWLSS